MGLEDQTQSSTNSGNNNIIGKSSKRRRPKKVPQRGLGVAQLEKIRLEEQQKKDSLIAADVSPSVQNTGPLTSLNGTKFGGSCCEFNIEKGLDPGWVFRTNLSLPYENESFWPFPCLMQRGQQPSSSMVNLSSRTSSSTSVMNFQMEPPSNQSYYKNYKPLLPEEDKVIGMKRSYPFSLDNVIGPILTKYHPINGQVEATSSGKVSTFNIESGTSNFREWTSCSTSNGVFGRDFLTLAPPTTTSNPISYELPDLDSLAYHQAGFDDSIMKQGGSGLNKDRPYYSFFPPTVAQIEQTTSITMAQIEQTTSITMAQIEQTTSITMAQIEQTTSITMANCKGGEVGEQVDLNLKL